MSQNYPVPYTFQSDTVPFHRGDSMEGRYRGVHIIMDADNLEMLTEKIESWFNGRDEIILVDAGCSEKQEVGFIILEWEECEIDPLFLAILRDEDIVHDYSLYIRDMEDY